MFQLLIVDDEQSVVDSLTLTIPWNDYGISEVHSASSGTEALSVLHDQAIDIVVTDIRMPRMNGLELIERISQMSKRIKCIVLSGYDDFTYAKKALQHQAIDYLLKPVDIDQLIEAVERAAKILKEEWDQISSLHYLQNTVRVHLPTLKDRLLYDILNNKPLSPNVLEEKLQLFKLHPFSSGGRITMMLVRLEEDFTLYDTRSQSLFDYAITNMAEEIFQDAFHLWHCITDQGFQIYLIKEKYPVSEEFIKSSTAKLQNYIETYLKGSVSVYISNPGVFPHDVPNMYQKSITAINSKVGHSKGFFITDDDISDTPAVPTTALYEPPLLSMLLESGRWDEAEQKLGKIFEELNRIQEPHPDQLMEVFFHLGSAYYYTANKHRGIDSSSIRNLIDMQLRKPGFMSVKLLKTWSQNVLIRIRKEVYQCIETDRHSIVHKVKKYVEDHLKEGISLQSIADHVHLHPVYLSKLYKTITGENIGDYLLALRMERAAFLLKNTVLKVNEITFLLGYAATPHFIKVFKKHYGVTPQEFREGVIKNV